MAHEDQRFLGKQPDARNLIVRSEQTSIESVRNPYLTLAGFSVQFPDRLRRLNDVLIERRPHVREISFELVPGQTPIIHTTIEHSSEGYHVYFKARPQSDQAELLVETRERFPSMTYALEDIQDFVRSAFPQREARLHTFREWQYRAGE